MFLAVNTSVLNKTIDNSSQVFNIKQDVIFKGTFVSSQDDSIISLIFTLVTLTDKLTVDFNFNIFKLTCFSISTLIFNV